MLRLSGKPFEIVSVSVDTEREDLVNFLKSKKPPGLQTWDEKGEDNPVAELYNVHHLPAWFLIDTAGNIRERETDPGRLAQTVEALLEPKKTP